MQDFWNIAIPLVALLGSMILAAVLLTRARAHAKPESTEEAPLAPPVPATASKRQRRVLEKLEPLPDLPTLMDLVRLEIADLGIEDIPGHEGVSGPVLLKVYRRDLPEGCDHDAIRYEVAEGVLPQEALEQHVALVCPECATPGTDPDE